MIKASEAKNITLESLGFNVENWWTINQEKLSEWIIEESNKGNSSLVINSLNCNRVSLNFEEFYYLFKLKEELSKLDYSVDSTKYDSDSEIRISW